MSFRPANLILLTPAHFLGWKPVTAVPETETKYIPVSKMTGFQHAINVTNNFGTNGRKNTLQSSNKGQNKVRNKQRYYVKGDIVLLKSNKLLLLSSLTIVCLISCIARETDWHPYKVEPS